MVFDCRSNLLEVHVCIYKLPDLFIQKENYVVVYVRILLDFKTSYILLLDSIDCFLFEFFHH